MTYFNIRTILYSILCQIPKGESLGKFETLNVLAPPPHRLVAASKEVATLRTGVELLVAENLLKN